MMNITNLKNFLALATAFENKALPKFENESFFAVPICTVDGGVRTKYFDRSVGLCSNLCDFGIGQVRSHLTRNWTHYSGDIEYPVPSPSLLIDAQEFYEPCDNKYIGTYGDLRISLLDHYINGVSSLLKAYEKLVSEMSSLNDVDFISKGQADILYKLSCQVFFISDYYESMTELESAMYDIILADGCPNRVYNLVEKLLESIGH